VDKLVALAWAVAVALLDRYLDSQIDRLKLNDSAKGTLRNVEDEVMRLLNGPLGEKIASAVGHAAGKAVVKRWLPNDPTTGTWG
jgi:hypothetical protein